MEDKVLRILQKLNLTEAEAGVYLLLLKQGSATASSLAKISGYSRPKVYEILGKLMKLGLAESFPDRPAKFRVFDPAVAIPSYITAKKEELEDVENLLKSSLKELFKQPTSKESQIFITRGFKNCSVKYCELVRNSENEIYSFLGWVSKREIEGMIKAYSVARESGVATNLACFRNATFKEQAEEKYIKKLSEIVTSFYPVPPANFPIPNPPAKFLLVDEHSVQIILGDYLDDGALRDVISVHYYNIPAFPTVVKKIVPVYFKMFFGRFKGGAV